MFVYFSLSLVFDKDFYVKNDGLVISSNSFSSRVYFNPIQDGSFSGFLRMGVGKKAHLSEICHTYPAKMKLGTYTLPKKDPKIYEPRVTLLEFC